MRSPVGSLDPLSVDVGRACAGMGSNSVDEQIILPSGLMDYCLLIGNMHTLIILSSLWSFSVDSAR